MDGFSFGEFIVGQVVSFILGVAASFLSWWVLVHRVVPRVGFANFISKLPADKGRNAYRIKFQNIGKRDLIDGYAVAVISIKGLHLNNWTSFRIPLNLAGETTITIPLLPRRDDRIFTLNLDLCRDFEESRHLPVAIRTKAARQTLSLEDLFALGKASRLRVYVAGSDSISAARKVFRSQPYIAQDIRMATFRGLNPGSSPDTRSKHGSNDLPLP